MRVGKLPLFGRYSVHCVKSAKKILAVADGNARILNAHGVSSGHCPVSTLPKGKDAKKKKRNFLCKRSDF